MTDAFNRRNGDVNVAAVATRVGALEGVVHQTVVPALNDNTRICKRIEDAVFGSGQDDGLQMKVQEMHDIFDTARNGIRVIAALGNGVISTLEVCGKVAKPLFFIVALLGALWGAVTNGEFHMPSWPP